MTAYWTVERTRDRRFPFRITIEQDRRTLLAVRAQNAWPGAGSQIFCLRETVHAHKTSGRVELLPRGGLGEEPASTPLPRQQGSG